jgi:hypothetical protein
MLFFPPIPPDVKGSLWWWITGYAAVALLLVEAGRRGDALTTAWAGLTRGRQWALGLGLAFAVSSLAVALRRFAPVLYERFQREEGLWEPLTLLSYLAAAVVLYRLSGLSTRSEGRHRRLVATVFLLLGLEEVDYFGVFGGIFGHVQGVYAGSLHDLIRLAVENALSPAAWMVIGGIFLTVLAGLWLAGYLQPRAVAAMVASPDFLWVSVGLGFLFAAAAIEARLFGWMIAEPTLEEALELSGAICFFGYALSVASDWRRGAAGRVTSAI